MPTHRIWRDTLDNLRYVHGARKAPPDAIMELVRLVEAVESKWLTFALDTDETEKPEPPPNRDTTEGRVPDGCG